MNVIKPSECTPLFFKGRKVSPVFLCKNIPAFPELSALRKVSCLYSDVREQDSTGGNTDDRSVLTPLNPDAVAFPSLVCGRKCAECGFDHLRRTVRTHVRSCECKLTTEPSLLNTDVWVSRIGECFPAVSWKRVESK